MIELADVISELRKELDRARLYAEGSALRFGLGPVELEVTVALDRETKAGGRVRFWVAEVDAEGKVASTSTQRIKLALQPTLDAPVEGREQATTVASPASAVTVYVHGAAVPGER
jgi:Trypsin-co-occurring domain 2